MTTIEPPFTRFLQKFGVGATWWRRQRGSKDSETGHSAETWKHSTTSFILSFPLQSHGQDTPAGWVDEERHEVHASTAFRIRDRLEWGGDTYEVEQGAQRVDAKNGRLYYRHIVVKRT